MSGRKIIMLKGKKKQKKEAKIQITHLMRKLWVLSM